jgi:hypothetical protein
VHKAWWPGIPAGICVEAQQKSRLGGISAGTSAHPAIRSVWWNSGNGSAWKVLKKIPHRHFVFSIPKILRRYFLYDRKLLAALSSYAWESLKVFIQQAVPEKEPIPGAVIAMQTFGDFLGFNPHCHILMTDGCFL